MQTRFLRQIGLSDESAFMHFNLAPLMVRRDIAILGVIHRAAMCAGPPQLWGFFRLDSSVPTRVDAKSAQIRDAFNPMASWAQSGYHETVCFGNDPRVQLAPTRAGVETGSEGIPKRIDGSGS